MGEVVNIEIVDKTIVISAERTPRRGWFERTIDAEGILDTIPLDEDGKEWEWE